jgi:hypothetical protein
MKLWEIFRFEFRRQVPGDDLAGMAVRALR